MYKLQSIDNASIQATCQTAYIFHAKIPYFYKLDIFYERSAVFFFNIDGVLDAEIFKQK